MTQLSLEYSNQLRGLAIIAVVLIHFLGGFPRLYSSSSPYLNFFVVIDQLSRFSVPLFVALSGYSFAQKYHNAPIKLTQLLKHQASKLLPLYLAANSISYLVFIFIPHWKVASTPQSFTLQLLFGRADYHLYFVPLIFQLYILFPLIYKITNKYPWPTLIGSGIFQLWLYQILNNPPNFLLTDQQQYIWFFTWIFYFMLGIRLPDFINYLNKITIYTKILFLALGFVSVYLLSSTAITSIQHEINPIIALRTTKVSVMLYATYLIVWLFSKIPLMRPSSFTKLIQYVGTHSYVIYLFHTLALRLFFQIFIY